MNSSLFRKVISFVSFLVIFIIIFPLFSKAASIDKNATYIAIQNVISKNEVAYVLTVSDKTILRYSLERGNGSSDTINAPEQVLAVKECIAYADNIWLKVYFVDPFYGCISSGYVNIKDVSSEVYTESNVRKYTDMSCAVNVQMDTEINTSILYVISLALL